MVKSRYAGISDTQSLLRNYDRLDVYTLIVKERKNFHHDLEMKACDNQQDVTAADRYAFKVSTCSPTSKHGNLQHSAEPKRAN